MIRHARTNDNGREGGKLPRHADAWLAFALVIAAIAMRFAPHPPNFTPVAAAAIFAGAMLASRGKWLVAPIAMLVSDAFIGFYNPVSMAFVYAGLGAGAVVGWALLRSRRSALRLVTASLSASVLFFMLSNFGVWLIGVVPFGGSVAYYPTTPGGLYQCYVSGLPFFRWTLLGDFVYTVTLFGAHALAVRGVSLAIPNVIQQADDRR